MSFEVIAFLVVVALLFDFMNGFHDAANSIATVVSTRVLRPHWAVVWAAFFNFAALGVFGVAVAATIGKGIIDPAVIDHRVVFGALVGGISWNVITWYYGIPSSSSHALIGGLAGAAVAKGGVDTLIGGGFAKTAVAIVLSPLLRQVHAAARGPMVPAAATGVGRPVQPGPRRQRRAEDHGHHLDAAHCRRQT